MKPRAKWSDLFGVSPEYGHDAHNIGVYTFYALLIAGSACAVYACLK